MPRAAVSSDPAPVLVVGSPCAMCGKLFTGHKLHIVDDGRGVCGAPVAMGRDQWIPHVPFPPEARRQVGDMGIWAPYDIRLTYRRDALAKVSERYSSLLAEPGLLCPCPKCVDTLSGMRSSVEREFAKRDKDSPDKKKHDLIMIEMGKMYDRDPSIRGRGLYERARDAVEAELGEVIVRKPKKSKPPRSTLNPPPNPLAAIGAMASATPDPRQVAADARTAAEAAALAKPAPAARSSPARARTAPKRRAVKSKPAKRKR